MLVKMALYGLKSLGAVFRTKLAGVLHGTSTTDHTEQIPAFGCG